MTTLSSMLVFLLVIILLRFCMEAPLHSNPRQAMAKEGLSAHKSAIRKFGVRGDSNSVPHFQPYPIPHSHHPPVPIPPSHPSPIPNSQHSPIPIPPSHRTPVSISGPSTRKNSLISSKEKFALPSKHR